MFNWSHNTAEMFVVDWSDKDFSQFEKLFEQTNQVCIFVKSGNSSVSPYDAENRKAKIISNLGKNEYIDGIHYIIIETPNIKGKYNA